MKPPEPRSEEAARKGDAGAGRWLADLKARVLQRAPELGARGLEDPCWVLLEVFAEALAEVQAEAELVEERVFPRLLESLGDEPRWTSGASTAIVFERDDRQSAGGDAVLVPRGTVVAMPRREGEARLAFETLEDAWSSPARLLRAVTSAGEQASEIFAHPQSGWDSEGVALFAKRQCIVRHLYLGDSVLSHLAWQAGPLVLEWPGNPQALSEGAWEYSVKGGWRAVRVELEEASQGPKRAVLLRIHGPLADLTPHKVEGASLPWLRLSLEGGRRMMLGAPRWVRAEAGSSGPASTELKLPRPVERIYSHGGERWEDHSFSAQKIVPVESPEGRDPAVYLGWDRPGPASLYWSIQGRPAPAGWAGRSGLRDPGIVWEHSAGRGFRPLEVEDGTHGFTRSGAVVWAKPADWAPQEHFGERLHWVRARWVSGAYANAPVVRALIPHAAHARQQSTLHDAVIGALLDPLGRGVLKFPIPEGFPEPFEAIELRKDGDWERGRFKVTLHPRDGYRLDAGAKWGGARAVKIPLLVAGWGSRGNVPAGSITLLEGTIQGVKRIVQPIAAEGGRDAESPEAFRTRIRSEWRSRGRAVTADDYRRLVLGLEPEAARVETAVDSGEPWRVKVCVVPHEPFIPGRFSPAHLEWLSEMLEARSPLGTVVEVMEPVYLPVDVRAKPPDGAVVPEPVRRRIEDRLRQFFHPLAGGPDGRGYPAWHWPCSEEAASALAGKAGEGDTRAVPVDLSPWRFEILRAGQKPLASVACEVAGQVRLPLVIPCLEKLLIDSAET